MFGSIIYTNTCSQYINSKITVKKQQGAGKMTGIIVMNIKKMLMIILITLVSVLVILAFYSNRHKFSGFETVKYVKISISTPVSAIELADRYSGPEHKDRFVSELKKINNLGSAGNINKNTVLIPVFGSN
jgi:hypothetical protein